MIIVTVAVVLFVCLVVYFLISRGFFQWLVGGIASVWYDFKNYVKRKFKGDKRE